MKLQTVTLYTMVGIIIGMALNLSQFPWSALSQRPQMILPLVGTFCLYGSLLFFFIHLYRKGQK